MKKKNNAKNFALITLGVFVLVGTYNAVVFNSKSDLSDYEGKLVKRLDEVYGVTTVGRKIAASNWRKLPSLPVKNEQPTNAPTIVQESRPEVAKAMEMVPEAAIKEELSLSLVEVINPTKWKQGLSSNEFSGSITTNAGVIENLVLSLPNTESMTVAFSEMTGNVFEYDLGGSSYSGMMYQVDQNSYMVTLTNGPLEGTRLRFSSADVSQSQETLAQVNHIETGSFGSEAQQEIMTTNTENELPVEAIQAQTFNFNQPTTM